MNYGAGYFMSQGKHLYSQIFFNHQPMMAYLSFLIIKFLHPANMFELLLRHKQALIIFSFIANLFIILRFRFAGAGFVLFFELSKYYLFGDRFLGESFIVYPMVYMIGIIWLMLRKQIVYQWEYIATAIATWFVLFTREPFMPVILIELFFILGKPSTRIKQCAYAIFLILVAITLAYIPWKEYIFQVFTINSQGVGAADAKATNLFGIGMIKVFFYPLIIFFSTKWNEFQLILFGVALVFFVTEIYPLVKGKLWKELIVLFVLFGLTNLRPVDPGLIFYSAFHLIPWFGMFLLITFLSLEKYIVNSPKRGRMLLIFLVAIFSGYILFSKSFIHTKTDPQVEFMINFGDTYEIGNIVRILSKPGQTFFIDNADRIDLSYIQSQRVSPYPYSWYGFVAPYNPVFDKAKYTMFVNNLPDFYYGTNKQIPDAPENTIQLYQPLYVRKRLSFLYVKKSIYGGISDDKWNQVKQFDYQK